MKTLIINTLKYAWVITVTAAALYAFSVVWSWTHPKIEPMGEMEEEFSIELINDERDCKFLFTYRGLEAHQRYELCFLNVDEHGFVLSEEFKEILQHEV